jgi:hypothetical protein
MSFKVQPTRKKKKTKAGGVARTARANRRVGRKAEVKIDNGAEINRAVSVNTA